MISVHVGYKNRARKKTKSNANKSIACDHRTEVITGENGLEPKGKE